MTGEHAIGRVIARPFEEASRVRSGAGEGPGATTPFRPPGRSYLQELQDAGAPVHGVGKIHDLFAGVGVDVKHPGATNAGGDQSDHSVAARP